MTTVPSHNRVTGIKGDTPAEYVYKDDEADELRVYLEDLIKEFFPPSKIEYFT